MERIVPKSSVYPNAEGVIAIILYQKTDFVTYQCSFYNESASEKEEVTN